MYVHCFDTETTLHGTGSFSADPHAPENWIVWYGSLGLFVDPGELEASWEEHGDKWDARAYVRELMTAQAAKVSLVRSFGKDDQEYIPVPYTSHDTCVLVAQNAKFDLLYLLNSTDTETTTGWEAMLTSTPGPSECHYKVWDTQQAQFRLLRQRVPQPSLDFIADSLGWAMKPGGMKEYWDAGVSTESIPSDEVMPYLEHDIITTMALYLHQQRELQHKPKLKALIAVDNAMVKETTLMEWRGMAFSDTRAEAAQAALEKKHETLTSGCAQYLPGLIKLAINPTEVIAGNLKEEQVWNPGSNALTGALLYGGMYKTKVRKNILDDKGRQVYFKSGKKKGEAKTRMENVELEFYGLVPSSEAEMSGSVDAKALAKIRYSLINTKVDTLKMLYEYLGYLLKLRKCNKELSTYLKGYQKAQYPDGRIRTNLTLNVTRTGRLSSRAPNLQNPSALAKQCFVSQFEGGAILEADYSQIEVVVLAQLTKSARMIEDIKNGVDFHCKRLAIVQGMSYEHVYDLCHRQEDSTWTAKRKGAKRIQFQAQYGATARNIAIELGMPLSEVRSVLEADARAYPEVAALWNRLSSVAEANCMRDVGEDGTAWGRIITPFGEEYSIPCTKRAGRWSAYRPRLMNYPVQGHAALLIKLAILKLAERIRMFVWHNRPCDVTSVPQIVLTVHDSIVMDLPDWVAQDAAKLKTFASMVDKTLRLAPPHAISKTLGVEYVVPLACEIEIGTSWSPDDMVSVDTWIKDRPWVEAGTPVDTKGIITQQSETEEK